MDLGICLYFSWQELHGDPPFSKEACRFYPGSVYHVPFQEISPRTFLLSGRFPQVDLDHQKLVVFQFRDNGVMKEPLHIQPGSLRAYLSLMGSSFMAFYSKAGPSFGPEE